MIRNALLVCCLFCAVYVTAQIPERPYPPRLVNDYTNLLTEAQRNQMEQELVAFDDSTGNQICVVIVNQLHGMDILDMAYQIGESWKVGQEEFDNGVVIVIKNKTALSGGEAAIATGYGLESVLTDAVCRRIIEMDMIPYFKEDEYYQGISKALVHIKGLASGEYHQEDIEDLEDGEFIGLIFFIILVIIYIIIAKKNRHSSGGGSSSSSGIFIGGFPLGGSSHGSFGGGSRGFGGFGGGSFGGGGAKGGW